MKGPNKHIKNEKNKHPITPSEIVLNRKVRIEKSFEFFSFSFLLTFPLIMSCSQSACTQKRKHKLPKENLIRDISPVFRK